MFLDEARKPPLNHFAHHTKIIARCDVGRFDIELAILILDEAFRPGNDHTTNCIRAHDMRVVIDFDAARRVWKAKGLGQTF